MALDDHPTEVASCFDPFGGSGTTALTAQLLGIRSSTVEINPFLADLIQAKVSDYDADTLARQSSALMRAVRRRSGSGAELFENLPPTFVEPGVNKRWIFGVEIAERVAAYVAEIAAIDDEDQRRFFRVLLGGLLIDVSNVVVNGKGRRYRRKWQERTVTPDAVDELFATRVGSAIADVHRFANRSSVSALVLRGDARKTAPPESFDVAIFSPPYPNSFDYTDVYNVELWVLGYLDSPASNRALRQATLTSHVQVHREFAAAPGGSPTLGHALEQLIKVQGDLWSPWIPAMIGGYFHDMQLVLDGVRSRIAASGACWLVVGDSRYGGVFVPTAQILGELASRSGWAVTRATPFRAMRSSAQHGGQNELAETLIRLAPA